MASELSRRRKFASRPALVVLCVGLSSLAFAGELEYAGLTFGKSPPDEVRTVGGESYGCQTDNADPPNEKIDRRAWKANALTRCTVFVNRGSIGKPSAFWEEFVFQRGVLRAVKLTGIEAGIYATLADEVAKKYAEYPENMRPFAVFSERRTIIITAHDAPFVIGAGISPPKLLERVDPAYPEASRKAKVEGVAIVEAVISTSGDLESVKLVKASDPLLGRSAVHAISQWKYTPATLDGEAIRVFVTVTSTFNLHDRQRHR